MPFQASSLPLPFPSPSVGPTSLLLDPLSSSLAVTLSDTSVLLFPTSSPSPSAVPTVVPPVSSSSSTFLLLNPNPKPKNPNPNSTLFVSASPSPSSPSVVLRSWILVDDRFSPVPLSFNNKLPRSKTLTLNLSHGFGVRIAGSVNYLAVHSAASRQIWVLGARMVGDGSDGKAVDFVKCAVVECVAPIYDLRMEKGVLVLGEVGGVRVFPLRPLAKGGDVGRRRSHRRDGAAADVGDRARGRLRTLKLRQNSGEFGSFFMMIKCAMVKGSDSNTLSSMKAVSIRILSQKKLLVLDSGGDLYLLNLENSDMAGEDSTVHSSIASACSHHLDVTMKVQMLAVHPELVEGKQVMWLSDGSHSVHVLSVDVTESLVRENDDDENKEKPLQISGLCNICHDYWGISKLDETQFFRQSLQVRRYKTLYLCLQVQFYYLVKGLYLHILFLEASLWSHLMSCFQDSLELTIDLHGRGAVLDSV